LVNEERYREAQKYFIKGLELKPTDTCLSQSFIEVLLKLGKTKKAEEIYLKIIELKPKFSSSYHEFGLFLLKEGRYEEAEHNYLKAIELGPRYVTYQLDLKEVRDILN